MKYFWIEPVNNGDCTMRSAEGTETPHTIQFEPRRGPCASTVIANNSRLVPLIGKSEEEAIRKYSDMVSEKLNEAQAAVKQHLETLQYLERFRVITKYTLYLRMIGKTVRTAHGPGIFKGFYSSTAPYTDRPCELVPHIFMVYLESCGRIVGVNEIEEAV